MTREGSKFWPNHRFLSGVKGIHNDITDYTVYLYKLVSSVINFYDNLLQISDTVDLCALIHAIEMSIIE